MKRKRETHTLSEYDPSYVMYIVSNHVMGCQGVFHIVRNLSSTNRRLRNDLKKILLSRMRFRLYHPSSLGHFVVRPDTIFDDTPLQFHALSSLQIGCSINETHGLFMQRYQSLLRIIRILY
jgi:hypothetical protein